MKHFKASLACSFLGLFFTAIAMVIVAIAKDHREINFALFVGAHALILSGAGLMALITDLKYIQKFRK